MYLYLPKQTDLYFARKLKVENFWASDGWINRWKSCFHNSLKKVYSYYGSLLTDYVTLAVVQKTQIDCSPFCIETALSKVFPPLWLEMTLEIGLISCVVCNRDYIENQFLYFMKRHLFNLFVFVAMMDVNIYAIRS